MSPRWCSVAIFWHCCLPTVKGQPPHPDPTYHSAWTGPGMDFRLAVMTYWDETDFQQVSIIINFPSWLERDSVEFQPALVATGQPGHFNLLWEPAEMQRARTELADSGFYLGDPDSISLNHLVFTGDAHDAVELTVSPTMTITVFSPHEPFTLPSSFCAFDFPRPD